MYRMYKISFLAFTIQTISISIHQFSELRASLPVVICIENLLKQLHRSGILLFILQYHFVYRHTGLPSWFFFNKILPSLTSNKTA